MSGNRRSKPKTLAATNFIRSGTESKQHQLLSMVLENFRQQRLYTDVVLECDGGSVLAHRIILSACSQYFQAMLDSELEESKSNVINFKHWSNLSVEIIIVFLYTGKTPKPEVGLESLREVARIAHLMQIEILFNFCWDLLVRSLVVENFAEMWSWVETYDIDNCKLIKQFADSNFKQISEDPTVLAMDLVHFRSLVNYMSVMRRANEIVRFILRWSAHERKSNGVMDLLKFVRLEELTNDFLHEIILNDRCLQHDADVKSVFTREAVARLVRGGQRDGNIGHVSRLFDDKFEFKYLDEDTDAMTGWATSSSLSPSKHFIIGLSEMCE